MDGRMGWMFSGSAGNGVASAAPAELKRERIFKTDEIRKEICAAAKGFCETALPGIENRHYEKVCICTVLRNVPRFRKVDTAHL
jgi:hypothetical protein